MFKCEVQKNQDKSRPAKRHLSLFVDGHGKRASISNGKVLLPIARMKGGSRRSEEVTMPVSRIPKRKADCP